MIHTGDLFIVFFWSPCIYGYMVIHGIGLWLNVFRLWYVGGYGGGAMAVFPKGSGVFVVAGKCGADAESDEGHRHE